MSRAQEYKKLIINDTSVLKNVIIQKQDPNIVRPVEEPEPNVIRVVAQGPAGPVGNLLVSGSTRPFAYNNSTGYWETTESIAIQDTLITSESISFRGFNPIIRKTNLHTYLTVTGSATIKQESDIDPLTIVSGSVHPVKVNAEGIFILHNFDTLPTAHTGSIAYSGSNFFFGE